MALDANGWDRPGAGTPPPPPDEAPAKDHKEPGKAPVRDPFPRQ